MDFLFFYFFRLSWGLWRSVLAGPVLTLNEIPGCVLPDAGVPAVPVTQMTEYMVTGAAERNEIAVLKLKPGFPVEGNDMVGF